MLPPAQIPEYFPFMELPKIPAHFPFIPHPNPTCIPAFPHPSLSAPGAVCDTWRPGSTSGCHQLGAHTPCHPTVVFAPCHTLGHRGRDSGGGDALQKLSRQFSRRRARGRKVWRRFSPSPALLGQRCSPSSKDKSLGTWLGGGLGTSTFPGNWGHPPSLRIPEELPQSCGEGRAGFSPARTCSHTRPCPRTRPRRCL